ncbi:hypothetical protein LTR50_006490 [Elasticomyces elasticus]|nr:hypothetical protein LTR50_006490 [Elasticomyces elasticus]
MSELLDFLRTHEEAFRSRARLASLYSDFRSQRAANPDGYAANTSAWLHALTSASRAGLVPSSRPGGTGAGNTLVLETGEALARALQTREWGRPLALGAVVRDAVARGRLVPLGEFLGRSGSAFARRWGPSAGQVVGWALRLIGVGGEGDGDGEERLDGGSFVVVASVEAAADSLLSALSATSTSNTSRIYTRSLFESTFANILDPTGAHPLTATDFSILLTYLSRDKPTLTHTATTIKLKSPTDPAPTPITTEDETIATLRSLILDLAAQTTTLHTRISALDSQIRTAIRAQQAATAKSLLRSKKLAAGTLAQRADALARLEDVFAAIERAADQVEMVRVMRASSAVLKTLHERVGGVEGVQGVVEELREGMEGVEEVGAALSLVGREGVGGEEVDVGVEVEFLALEREERDRREAEETRMKLDELERQERWARQEAERRAAERDPNDVVQTAGKDGAEKEMSFAEKFDRAMLSTTPELA